MFNMLVIKQMNDNVLNIIITIYTLLLLCIGYKVYKNKHKRWRCIEGNCEIDIDGVYLSKSDCLESCKK